jgi:glutamate racemase
VCPSLPETADHGTATFKGQGFRLGIFDSGLGGLSILRAVRAALPEADLLYVADSGHAPYGERDDEFVSARSSAITAFLLAQGVDAVVVACNTATAAAVHHLREHWPHLPVIGVEPGVKPAVHHSGTKRVGVLATPVTLASEKFATLVAQHGQHAHIVLQPCPGLAREIERGELDTPALRALVAQFSRPLLDEGVDTVALGCTHYPLVESLFREALGPGVQIIDTSEAVARQVIRKAMASLALQADQKKMGKTTTGATMLWSSGDPAHLSEVARCWLGLSAPAHPLSV